VLGLAKESDIESVADAVSEVSHMSS